MGRFGGSIIVAAKPSPRFSPKGLTMSARFIGLLILIASVCAFGSAATSALWADQGGAQGGIIVTGDLNISLLDSQWDQVNVPVQNDIDPTSFLMARGDRVVASQDFQLSTSGTNMVAQLSVTLPAATGTGTLKDDLSITYTLLDEDGQVVSGISAVPVGQVRTVNFGNIAARNLDETYTLEITFDFPDSIPDRVRTNENARLTEVELTLQQVRS